MISSARSRCKLFTTQFNQSDARKPSRNEYSVDQRNRTSRGCSRSRQKHLGSEGSKTRERRTQRSANRRRSEHTGANWRRLQQINWLRGETEGGVGRSQISVHCCTCLPAFVWFACGAQCSHMLCLLACLVTSRLFALTCFFDLLVVGYVACAR